MTSVASRITKNVVFALPLSVDPSSNVYTFAFLATIENIFNRCEDHGSSSFVSILSLRFYLNPYFNVYLTKILILAFVEGRESSSS